MSRDLDRLEGEAAHRLIASHHVSFREAIRRLRTVGRQTDDYALFLDHYLQTTAATPLDPKEDPTR